jgi:hypothetical protein
MITVFQSPSAGCSAPDRGPGPISRRISRILQLSASAMLLLLAAPGWTQAAPDLGSTDSFAITSETFTNTTAGTTIDGDVCFTTGPGVAPTINGDQQTPCPDQIGIDQGAALAELNEESCTSIGAEVALDQISIGDGPPGEFPSGCYSSTGAMTITTGQSVTLTGTGVYIFRSGGALDPAADTSIVLADGACEDNVFWAPNGSTTIGANTDFVGTIFRGSADGLSITLGDAASLRGRALAFGSTVTTDNNTISLPEACEDQGTIIVEKQTDPPGSLQSFTFTGDAAGELMDGEQIVNELAAGEYSATEIVPEGWELTDITCGNAESSGDLTTATANFVVAAAEIVTCVFTNTLLAGEFGTITIVKQASPSDTDQLFSFSGDLGNFELMHGESFATTVSPGTYGVSEAVPDGWQLDSATCDDGSPVNAIELEAGENVTCTFNNSQLAMVAPLSVPIFSQPGLALLLLLMLVMAARCMQQTKLARK